MVFTIIWRIAASRITPSSGCTACLAAGPWACRSSPYLWKRDGRAGANTLGCPLEAHAMARRSNSARDGSRRRSARRAATFASCGRYSWAARACPLRGPRGGALRRATASARRGDACGCPGSGDHLGARRWRSLNVTSHRTPLINQEAGPEHIGTGFLKMIRRNEPGQVISRLGDGSGPQLVPVS